MLYTISIRSVPPKQFAASLHRRESGGLMRRSTLRNCPRTRPPERVRRELLRDLNAVMLAGASQLVCDQIEGADWVQSDPAKNHYSGTLVEWRGTEQLPTTHKHCLRIDRHDRTGENPGDKHSATR